MNSIKNLAAAFTVMALTAGAQAATIPFGPIDGTTDSFSTVTWKAKSTTQSDLYTFTVADAGEYSFTAQAVTASGNFGFTGGELLLFAAGSSTPFDSISFDVVGSTLSDYLAVGSYSFEIEGKTTGKSGGRYNIAVSAVPEPTSIALMLAGLGMIGGLARRRRQG
jgi:hypothetical protein